MQESMGLDMMAAGRAAASVMLLAFGLVLLFPSLQPDGESFSLAGWRAPISALALGAALFTFPRDGFWLRLGAAGMAVFLAALWAFALSQFSFSL